jgi:hypothetical protein
MTSNDQAEVWTTSLKLGEDQLSPVTDNRGLEPLEFIHLTPQLSRNMQFPCLKDTDDEIRRLQSETHSSQSVRVKSAPSTSDEHAGLESHESGAYEVNTNVNTPRKILKKMYPMP